MSNTTNQGAETGSYWADDELPGDDLDNAGKAGNSDEGEVDDHVNTVEEVQAKDQPPKKKSRKIFVIVAVVVLLALVSAIAAALLLPSPKKPKPRPVPQVTVAPEAPPEEASSPLMMDAGASGVTDAAAVAAATGVAAGQLGAPAQAAQQVMQGATGGQTMSQPGVAQPVAQAAAVQGHAPVAGGNYASAEAVSNLSEEVRRLRVNVDALMASKSGGASSARAITDAGAQGGQTVRARPKVAKAEKAADKIVTEKAGDSKISTAMEAQKAEFAREPRLKLRGVYPPQGDDQQAWVVDGGAVSVVTKGDKLRGATVLSISGEVVRTTLGDVRY